MSRSPLPLLLAFATPLLAGCASLTPTGRSVDPPLPSESDVVWITGSTNRYDFTCLANDVAISTEAALGEFDRTKADGVPAVKSAALAIPVKSLDCGIDQMNRDLARTLDAAKYPMISFTMGNYTIVDRSLQKVKMDGVLRIRGREQPVVVNALVRRENGVFRLRGERAINLRTYGIDPPTRFLGLVRVDEVVTVHFDVAVRPLVDPLGMVTSSLH